MKEICFADQPTEKLCPTFWTTQGGDKHRNSNSMVIHLLLNKNHYPEIFAPINCDKKIYYAT